MAILNMKSTNSSRRCKMSEQQNREQVIIDGLITTLGYREQRINELQNENIALKARAEIAENKVRYLLKRLDEVQNDTK